MTNISVSISIYFIIIIIQAHSGSHITLLSTDVIINRDVRKFVVHVLYTPRGSRVQRLGVQGSKPVCTVYNSMIQLNRRIMWRQTNNYYERQRKMKSAHHCLTADERKANTENIHTRIVSTVELIFTGMTKSEGLLYCP